MDFNQRMEEMKRDMERKRREMEERMKGLSSTYYRSATTSAQRSETFGSNIEPYESPKSIEDKTEETKQSVTKSPLPHLPGLESESESKLAMFERLYDSIYCDVVSPKSFAAFGYSDTDFSPLTNLLASIGEIELYEALYELADEILPEPWIRNKTCYGDFIKFIERERIEKYLSRHDINPKKLVKQLKEISEVRNSCNHKGVVTLAGFDRFFHKTYTQFFNDTLPLIIKLKKNSSVSSFGKGYGFLDSFSDNKTTALDLDLYLDQIAKTLGVASPANLMDSVEPGSEICVVLTDTIQLSIKYHQCERGSGNIRSKLEAIINEMSVTDRKYILFDTSDNEWTEYLKDGKSWLSYVRILDRIHEIISQGDKNAVHHLLIIGGDDVIPMPRLYNPVFDVLTAKGEDQPLEQNLETDMVYNYSSDCISLERDNRLDIMKLCRNKPSFFVGRLPLESGLIPNQYVDDIFKYMLSDLKYSQTPMHVNKVGAVAMERCTNISRILNKGLPLADLSHIDKTFAKNDIFLSPGISIGEMPETIAKTFVSELRDCDMLTFLTHGTSDPSISEFVGEPYSMDANPVAFESKILEDSKVRIMVPMSCWGARFIGYEREKSILIQSLYDYEVMVFMGSSRSSWSYMDPGEELVCGHLVIRNFILYLLAGKTAGEAMFYARLSVLRNNKEITPHDLTSVQEFNLFGDPMFRLSPTMSVEKLGATLDKNIPDLDNIDVVVDTKVIFQKETGSTSILDRVRNLVDSNLNSIRNRINDILYKQYNIEGRDLSTISRFTTKHGRKGMNFVYKRKSDAITSYTIARTDSEGNLEAVIQSF